MGTTDANDQRYCPPYFRGIQANDLDKLNTSATNELCHFHNESHAIKHRCPPPMTPLPNTSPWCRSRYIRGMQTQFLRICNMSHANSRGLAPLGLIRQHPQPPPPTCCSSACARPFHALSGRQFSQRPHLCLHPLPLLWTPIQRHAAATLVVIILSYLAGIGSSGPCMYS